MTAERKSPLLIFRRVFRLDTAVAILLIATSGVFAVTVAGYIGKHENQQTPVDWTK